jgi:hypothetical protein
MEITGTEWPYLVSVTFDIHDLLILKTCFCSEAAMEVGAEDSKWQHACAMESTFFALALYLSEAETRHDELFKDWKPTPPPAPAIVPDIDQEANPGRLRRWLFNALSPLAPILSRVSPVSALGSGKFPEPTRSPGLACVASIRSRAFSTSRPSSVLPMATAGD